MSQIINQLLEPINAFLQCPTPQSWIDEAIKPENLPNLLRDHANCEQLA
jgi:tRNA-(ms[2]io[6]A)-hydroxylase